MRVIPGVEVTLVKFAPMGDSMELPHYHGKKQKIFYNALSPSFCWQRLLFGFSNTLIFILILQLKKKDSILATISGWLVPIFKPLGLGDWRICTSLITGVLAKESVVSTMKVLFGSELSNALTTSSALALLVFITLYTPCIAAISSVNRELGKRWALFMVIWQFVLACMLAVLSVLLFNGFVG